MKTFTSHFHLFRSSFIRQHEYVYLLVRLRLFKPDTILSLSLSVFLLSFATPRKLGKLGRRRCDVHVTRCPSYLVSGDFRSWLLSLVKFADTGRQRRLNSYSRNNGGLFSSQSSSSSGIPDPLFREPSCNTLLRSLSRK